MHCCFAFHMWPPKFSSHNHHPWWAFFKFYGFIRTSKALLTKWMSLGEFTRQHSGFHVKCSLANYENPIFKAKSCTYFEQVHRGETESHKEGSFSCFTFALKGGHHFLSVRNGPLGNGKFVFCPVSFNTHLQSSSILYIAFLLNDLEWRGGEHVPIPNLWRKWQQSCW